jgi:hypothetical protein
MEGENVNDGFCRIAEGDTANAKAFFTLEPLKLSASITTIFACSKVSAAVMARCGCPGCALCRLIPPSAATANAVLLLELHISNPLEQADPMHCIFPA